MSVTGAALTAAAEAGGAGVLAGFFAMNKLQIGAATLVALAGVGLLTVELGTREALAAKLARAREQSAVLAALPPLAARDMRIAPAMVVPVAPAISAAATVMRPAPLSAEAEEQRAQLAALLAAGMKPDVAWQNLGRDTPAAALETMLWAWRQRDYAALGDSLMFDAPGKAALAAWFVTLPASVRAKYRTPEQIVAPAFAAYTAPLAIFDLSTKAMRGYKIVPLPSGTPARHDEGQMAVLSSISSDVNRPDILHFTRDATGWRQGPISEQLVGALIAGIDPGTGEYIPPRR